MIDSYHTLQNTQCSISIIHVGGGEAELQWRVYLGVSPATAGRLDISALLPFRETDQEVLKLRILFPPCFKPRTVETVKRQLKIGKMADLLKGLFGGQKPITTAASDDGRHAFYI